MQTTESVEYWQRRRELITIIKGTHIGIAVGLWVDGTTKVILGTDVAIHRRQEITDSTGLRCLIVVEFQLGLFHLVIMLHRILHALLHGPIALSRGLLDGHCQTYHQ